MQQKQGLKFFQKCLTAVLCVSHLAAELGELHAYLQATSSLTLDQDNSEIASDF